MMNTMPFPRQKPGSSARSSRKRCRSSSLEPMNGLPAPKPFNHEPKSTSRNRTQPAIFLVADTGGYGFGRKKSSRAFLAFRAAHPVGSLHCDPRAIWVRGQLLLYPGCFADAQAEAPSVPIHGMKTLAATGVLETGIASTPRSPAPRPQLRLPDGASPAHQARSCRPARRVAHRWPADSLRARPLARTLDWCGTSGRSRVVTRQSGPPAITPNSRAVAPAHVPARCHA